MESRIQSDDPLWSSRDWQEFAWWARENAGKHRRDNTMEAEQHTYLGVMDVLEFDCLALDCPMFPINVVAVISGEMLREYLLAHKDDIECLPSALALAAGVFDFLLDGQDEPAGPVRRRIRL